MLIDIHVGTVKGASEQSIAPEIASQWEALRQNPAMRDYAQSVGIDLQAIDDLEANPFIAESPGDNVGIAEAVLIGVATNVATAISVKTLTLIWNKILVPALRKGGRIVESGQDAAA